MKVDEMHARMMEGMSGKDREDFEAGLKALGYENPADQVALREAFKKQHPEWTEAQLDAAMRGY